MIEYYYKITLQLSKVFRIHQYKYVKFTCITVFSHIYFFETCIFLTHLTAE